jgi:hypothetical protein
MTLQPRRHLGTRRTDLHANSAQTVSQRDFFSPFQRRERVEAKVRFIYYSVDEFEGRTAAFPQPLCLSHQESFKFLQTFKLDIQHSVPTTTDES